MPKIYVKMPENGRENKIFEIIRHVCDVLGLDIFSEGTWQYQIENSAFVIADISKSGEFSSVAFHIGYAFRVPKTIFLIAQKDSPVDNFGQENVLFYDVQDTKPFEDNFMSNLIALCQKQKIRYNRPPQFPEKKLEGNLPVIWPQNRRMQSYVSIGDSCVDSFQYEEAHQEYSRAILYIGSQGEFTQEHSYLFFKRAFVAKKMRLIDSALEDYGKAIELSPNFVDAYIARGLTLYEQKRYNEALQDFQKASELKPDFTKAYVYAGRVCRLTKDYENALVQLNKAIELNPHYADAYYERGLVYIDSGLSDEDYPKALENFNQAILLNPEYTDAFIKRGQVYMSRQKYDLAIQDFNSAIQFSPKNTEAYHWRGQALVEKGYKEFYELAIQDWQKAIELGSPEMKLLQEKIKAVTKTI